MEPATAAATSPAAGWFADPHVPDLLRWWDGFQWTEHTHPVAPAAQQHQAAPPSHLQPAAAQPSHLQPVAAQPSHLQPAAAQPSHLQAAPASVHPGHAHAVAPATTVANGFASPYADGQAPATHANAFVGGAASAGGALLTQPGTGDESLFEANSKSFFAIGVSAIYLVLAITAGIVVAGIVPALFTFEAFKNKEKLAPVALLAAIGAIAFAVTHWQTGA